MEKEIEKGKDDLGGSNGMNRVKKELKEEKAVNAPQTKLMKAQAQKQAPI